MKIDRSALLELQNELTSLLSLRTFQVQNGTSLSNSFLFVYFGSPSGPVLARMLAQGLTGVLACSGL